MCRDHRPQHPPPLGSWSPQQPELPGSWRSHGCSMHHPMQWEDLPCFPQDSGDGKTRRTRRAAGTGREPELQGPVWTSVISHQLQLSHQRLSCLIAPLLPPRDIVASGVTLKRSLPLFTPPAINVPGEVEGLGWAAGAPRCTQPAVKFPIRLQIHETPSALWLPHWPGGCDRLP